MKLGPLKTAIRNHSGSVEIWSARLDAWVAVQKGSFIAALDQKFGKNNVETDMVLTDEGRIHRDEEMA